MRSGTAQSDRPTPAQQALLRDVAAHRETFLQAWWAQRLWQGGILRTRSGATLEVLEPGWLNRSGGPDFTAARLLIDGQEHWGDVEVHLDEDDWWRHAHHENLAYERVILHLVLRRGRRPALRPHSVEPLPVLEAQAFLTRAALDVMEEPDAMLRHYEALPGRCGLRAALAGPDAVQRLVAHAAEERARAKSERIGSSAGTDDDEQLLYRQLCFYLGYRPHSALFEALARRFPVAALAPLLEQPLPAARDAVLARWFGSAGLLEAERPGADDPVAAEEYARLRDQWRGLGLAPVPHRPGRAASRPWNSAERRLVGLFHHIHALGRGGWLRGWLRLLRGLDALRDAPEFRRAAMGQLEAAFATQPDEPWRGRVSYDAPPAGRRARLIGAERVVVLMANAILPAFLAFARRDGDRELEKLLYRLYIVLPPEGVNQRTRFMERRLAPVTPLNRSLRSQQGLLQIHADFCRNFYEGCERCRLPDLIGPEVRPE